MIEKRTSAEVMRAKIAEGLSGKAETIDSGKLEGERVYRVSAVSAALWETPLPEPSSHAAELRTPGRIVVWAYCPNCGIPAVVSLSVAPVLTVEGGGSSLKVAAKSKPASHICGQTTLPLEEEIAGQETAWDLTAVGAAIRCVREGCDHRVDEHKLEDDVRPCLADDCGCGALVLVAAEAGEEEGEDAGDDAPEEGGES